MKKSQATTVRGMRPLEIQTAKNQRRAHRICTPAITSAWIACLAICASSYAQPAPAVYTWSWNPNDALVRVEAQVFVDESNCSNICFDNPDVPPWPDADCMPPNPPPLFWHWSILPPVPPPAPPPPRAVPPLDWDEYAPGPPGMELGTIFVGDYCPCPTSDAQGNPPPPPPIGAFPDPPLPLCGVEWSQRVNLLVPIGLTFHNMLGHPSLMPERQVVNSVLAADGDVPWATVQCFNAPFVPPGVNVTGEVNQVVTARGQRGLIGTVAHYGVRTWELRSTNRMENNAFYPPGADRYVSEGCGTIVTQIPLLIEGLTPGVPAKFTFEFETLGETANAKESHPYLDSNFNLFVRPDADNAYALAQIKMYENGLWSTNFIEYAGNPPGVPSPGPNSSFEGGSVYLFTPTSTTYPVVLRMTSRVRTHLEDDADLTRFDDARASMKTNMFVTVFGPPVVGQFEMVPAGGPGPAYDFWMSKYEISNVEYVDFLNDAELDASNPNGPSEKSAFMAFDPTTGNVSTPAGVVMFMLIDSPTPGSGGMTSAQKIRYRPFLPPGTRYVVDSGAEPDAVIGVSWLGAVKYCNWLTLRMGYPPSDRCYTEGNGVDDWHPVTISTADWVAGDLDNAQRADLVANYRGFRLPMDNLGTALGHLSNQHNGFNEWYKASAYDPAAPNFSRNGPGGETVPALHWIYGFGRDLIAGADANYVASGDLFDDGVAHIGYFDGVNHLTDGTSTNDTSNPFGFYDLSGNVDEWGQDQGPGFAGGQLARITRTGSWQNVSADVAASRRTQASPSAISTTIGFRVLTTSPPPSTTPPNNDHCVNAGPDLTPGAFSFDTTFASTDGPAEPCGFTGIDDADVWLRVITPCNGTAELTVTGTFNRLVGVYTDCPFAGGVLIGCSAGIGPAPAIVTFPTVAGQTYFVRVGGMNGAAGIATIDYEFQSCAGDVTPPPFGDCAVNVQDLLAVIGSWGACPPPCPRFCDADVNHDCTVNVADLLTVINSWGPCP